MPEIRYELTADTAGFTSGIAGAKAAMMGATKAAGLLASGILAAGAAMVSFIEDTSNLVDELNTLAGVSGLSIDTVNGLRLAANAAGKDLKDLVPQDLSTRILKAFDGSKKAAKGFDDLGVSVKDANGNLRSADAVFRDTLDAILSIEDPTMRAALSTQALGAQGAQALTAFGDVDDLETFVELGRQFGTDVGPGAVDSAGAWIKATSELSLAFEEAGAELFKAFGVGGFLTDLVRNFALGFNFISATFTSMIEDMITNLNVVGTAFGKLFRGDFKGAAQSLSEDFIFIGEALDNGFTKGFKSSFNFWKLQQQEAPKAEKAIRTGVTQGMKDAERAAKDLTKAIADVGKANDKLAGIAASRQSVMLTAEEKAHDAFQRTELAILAEKERLEELGATGIDVSLELAQAKQAEIENKAALEFELSRIVAAEQAKRLAEEERIANERLADIERLKDSAAEIEAERTAIEQEQQAIRAAGYAELNSLIQDGITATTTLVIDSASAEGDAIRERIAAEEEILAVKGKENKANRKNARARIRQLDAELEAQQGVVNRAFGLQKAAAISQIAINAAQSIVALLPFFAFAGPGAPALAAGVVTPVAVLQASVVGSQKPPKLHDGTGNVDEVLAALRSGESVLNQRGSEAVGRARVDAANRGEPIGGASINQIVFQGRVLDSMMSRTIASGGRTQRLIAKGRPPAGTLDPFGGQ